MVHVLQYKTNKKALQKCAKFHEMSKTKVVFIIQMVPCDVAVCLKALHASRCLLNDQKIQKGYSKL